ncbi:MAG: CFI-box-CTERM domain-containing protein [Bdellovibrionota bacterium]
MANAAADESGITTCPHCGDTVSTLRSIEPGMKLRLQEHANINPAPDQVCEGCFKIMSKMVSKGAALRAEAQAKENNRLMLWKNRVMLIKQAKNYVAQKNFSDAAVSYEKYLKVLEIVYDQKPGGLKPELFKADRGQEMTVITSVYWDLMRVYDSNPRYAERQMKAAEKLAEFARYTPIFPQIMRKAEAQTRQAKNPDAFKKFIKLSNSKRPRCFIATAAFEYRSPEVEALCRFRDERLKTSRLGRRFVRAYYRVSPSIASFLDRHPSAKAPTRALLTRLSKIVS